MIGINKPAKGLKMIGYFTKTDDGTKHYKTWHYYMWIDTCWRIIPHQTWCAIARMLSLYGINENNIFLKEEYELLPE